LLNVQHHIIGNNRIMLEAVTRAAQQAGLHTQSVAQPITGETRVVVKQ
jgi:hydroxypyruvate reductase